VQHSIYDPENKFNRILLKALDLVGRLSTQVGTRAAVAQIRLNFPDLPDLAVNDALFERLPWSRKTEAYRKAIDIARLLLLNYHPDIRGGKEDVVALMFDMNKLWERYIIQILRRSAPHGWTVEDRENRLFWRGEAEKKAHLKPDIVLLHPESDKIVLDTKWKVVDGRPSDHDLRQLFAYQHHWIAPQGYLVYPDTQLNVAKGRFQNSQYALHVMGVDVLLSNAVLNPHLGLLIWEKLLDLPPQNEHPAILS
jgi:5-methylcytosine-specific restriction enzyme subunit McrC